MLLGYCRVSSEGQDLAIQEEQLAAAGCEKIFAEKKSGKSVVGREELEAAIKFAREGDVIVVTRLDRFARSMSDFCILFSRLEQKKVGFKCLLQQVDTSGAAGRAMAQMLMIFAEFENSIRAERQREGIDKAMRKGTYKRAQKKRTRKLIERLLEIKAKYPKFSAKEVALAAGVSVRTVYRRMPGVWNDAPQTIKSWRENGSPQPDIGEFDPDFELTDEDLAEGETEPTEEAA